MIPVFIEQTDNAEEALRASDFKPIWDVLEALKSHDNRLSDELDRLRIELGAKRRWSVGANDLTKIVFDLPTSVNKEFAQSLRTHLVAQTTESWMFWYGLLETFLKGRGHCRVVRGYKTGDGYLLGAWVHNQRRTKDKIEPDRRQRLEALPGWSWDPHSDQWEEGFFHLKQFSDREKHCRVSATDKTDTGYRLGQWVGVQRRTKHALEPDRRRRLEVLPGWSWDPLSDKWEEGFSHLQEFSKRAGHCRMLAKYKTDDGFGLGIWVNKQREKTDTIEPDRRERLEALPGWLWNPHSEKWEKGFSHLKQFSDRETYCRVPVRYETDDGYRLGQWVNIQRTTKESINLGRRRRLEALPGWSWDVRSEQWEEGFYYLEKYSEKEGHCRVVQGYKTDDGFGLGIWVNKQRGKKHTIEPNRRQRLEALPGWSWDPHSDQWEEGFFRLKQFSDREKHCRVSLWTKPTLVIGLVSGLEFKGEPNTRLNLIVGGD